MAWLEYDRRAASPSRTKPVTVLPACSASKRKRHETVKEASCRASRLPAQSAMTEGAMARWWGAVLAAGLLAVSAGPQEPSDLALNLASQGAEPAGGTKQHQPPDHVGVIGG